MYTAEGSKRGYLDGEAMVELMGDISRKLDTPDLKSSGATLKGTAEQIESRRLSRQFFRVTSLAMVEMLAIRNTGIDEDTIMGPIFPTGLDGGIAALMLLPRSSGKWGNVVTGGREQVDAATVISGTPVIAVIRDRTAAERINGKNHVERRAIWNDVLAEKGSLVKSGEILSAEIGGGWGHQPTAFLRRAELALHAVNDKGIPYGALWLPGFFGSMDTLHPMLMRPENAELRKTLRLGFFANQVEQVLSQIAELYEPGIDGAKNKSEYFQMIANHSMGAYLSLAISRIGTHLPIIEAIKQTLGTTIVADKPVIVGARYPLDQMPEWMQEIVLSEGYQSHVELQQGILGAIVRFGVADGWGEMGLDGVRELALNNGLVPGVNKLFTYFLNPANMFDGANVYDAHSESYARYRKFHRLCVELLDSADPIVGKNTMIDMAAKNLPWIRMLFGGSDNILNHGMGVTMAKGLGIGKGQVQFDGDGVHHPNFSELKWMYKMNQQNRS